MPNHASLNTLFGHIAGQPEIESMIGKVVKALEDRRDESLQSTEESVDDTIERLRTFLLAAPQQQVEAFEAINRVASEMDFGASEDSAGPILSDKLEDVLFAVGFDVAKFKQILRAFCDADLHAVSALLIWILEQFGSIVAQVDDALIPEHVARMIAQLEQKDFDFDDLSLGEQITARFLLGRELGRLTPWETGIPLSGIFIGFRLTDVEVDDQPEKNIVRFSIVGSSGSPIRGTLRLLGLDAFDRAIQPFIEKHLRELRVQSEAFQHGEKSDDSQTIQSQFEELNTFDSVTGIAQASVHSLSDDAAAPRALVMKGGGIKGLAYVGALEILARKYEFNWFIGTSAGAITAILLGAGYTAEDLREILKGKDFRDFFDARWYQMPFNLWFHKGVYHADSFTKWIDTILAKKLESPVRVKFSKLSKRVTVYASRREKQVLTFDSFSSEDDAAYAARCSMSIPLVFVPQFHQGIRTYDGGIKNNYPVDKLLDEYPGTKFIGLYLGAETYEGIERASVLADIVSIVMESSEPDDIEKYRDSTVIIDTRPINTLDFALTDDEKEFLLQAGRTAALGHLDKMSDEYAMAVEKRDKLKKAVEDARSAAALKRRLWRWFILPLLLISGFAIWTLWLQTVR